MSKHKEIFPHGKHWANPTEELQFSEKGFSHYNRKISAPTVHYSLLCMGMHRDRLVRIPMLTSVHCWMLLQWPCAYQNWTMVQWKKVTWSDDLYIMLTAECICLTYLGSRWLQDAPWEKGMPAKKACHLWQWSGEYLWVLAFMQMLLWPTKIVAQLVFPGEAGFFSVEWHKLMHFKII